MNKKYIKNIILVLVVSIFVITFISSQSDFNQIIDNLVKVNWFYLGIAIIILLIHWVLWSNTLQSLIMRKNSDISNVDNYLIAGSDFLFNGITPYASGGQPFQLYAYTRAKVKGSDATSSLTMNFIIHQISLMLISTISLIFLYEDLVQTVSMFSRFVVISYIINLIILIMIFLICLCPKVVIVIRKLIELLCKIEFLNRFLAAKTEGVEKFVAEFQSSFYELQKNKLVLLRILLTKCLCLLALYAIPYFIVLSLNIDLEYTQFWLMIGLSSLNHAVVSCVPIPGGSGGAEFGMSKILLLVPGLDTGIIITTMLLWRFLTYYLTMLYGFVLYIIFEKRVKK